MWKALIKQLSPKTEILRSEIVTPTKTESKHLHSWEIVAHTYAPPFQHDKVDSNFSSAVLEKFAFGVTTLLWECPKCGETRKEEMLGSDEDTLEELVQKVKKTGAQYIERDGETYIFNKWNPASTIPGNIPIR